MSNPEWGENDHDRIVRLVTEYNALRKDVDELKADNRILMAARAKLIAICTIAAAAVSLVIKFFLPKS